MMRLRVGLSDVVYVVTCSPVIGAVKRALESLRALCLKQGFPEPQLVEVNCRDFYESVKRIREVVAKHTSREIYLCTGGGLRILTVIIETALLATRF